MVSVRKSTVVFNATETSGYEHEDGQRRPIGNGRVPILQAFLCDAGCEETRGENETPLCPGVLRYLELSDGILDTLGGCSCDDGIVFPTCFVHALAHMRQQGLTFAVGDCDCFACGTKKDESSDTAGGKMERMFCLRRDVELWDAPFGFRLGEERGNRHIDSWRRWCGHCVRYAGIFGGDISAKHYACCCIKL